MKQMKILVVEDVKFTRLGLADELKKVGYLPVTASDKQSALECFIEHCPELAIIDISIPSQEGLAANPHKTEGLNLAAKIRQIAHQTKIIIYSTHSRYRSQFMKLAKFNPEGLAYLLKYQLDADALFKVIEKIKDNELYIDPEIPQDSLIDELYTNRPAYEQELIRYVLTKLPDLSEKKLEIIKRIAMSYYNESIGKSTRDSNVSTLISRLFQELGIPRSEMDGAGPDGDLKLNNRILLINAYVLYKLGYEPP